MNNETVSKKSRLVALILCLFLGVFGLHRMYVGKFWTGLIQLILTFSFIGIYITGIWVLLDFIVILIGQFTDGKKLLIANWLD